MCCRSNVARAKILLQMVHLNGLPFLPHLCAVNSLKFLNVSSQRLHWTSSSVSDEQKGLGWIGQSYSMRSNTIHCDKMIDSKRGVLPLEYRHAWDV